jgi:hypothetical protein
MNLKHVHDTITTLAALAARQGGTTERPLERGLPRSRAECPLGWGPPRSRAARPLGWGLPRSRAPSSTAPPLLLTRAGINALTPQDARHDPDAPGNHASALLHRIPEEGHPRHCVTLCGEAGVSSVTRCRLLLYG